MPAPKGHAPYNVNGEGGRPETYTEEIINNLADELLKWIRYPNNIFFEEFTLEKGIHPEHMSRWAAKNDRFRQALKLARANQENRLKKGASYGVLKDGFIKFLLINNHGDRAYSERLETKVTTNDDSPDSFVMNRIKSTKDLVDGIPTDD